MSKRSWIILLVIIAGFVWVGTAFAGYQFIKDRQQASSPEATLSDEIIEEPNDLDNVPTNRYSEPELNEIIDEKKSETTKPEQDLKDKAKEENPPAEPQPDDDEENVYYINAVPNDPIYPQWYTDAISAPNAWDITPGSDTVTVAVIDTGFSTRHQDLGAAWQRNSGELGKTKKGDRCWTGKSKPKKSNNCDDDRNGFVDDFRGWDFANNDNSPKTNEHGVGASHGTKVSGLVAARTNNNTGVASINWQAKIMPLQALYDEGFGFTSDIVAAVVYAVDNGADVINMSLGSAYSDPTMQSAVQYARDHDVIIVAAAGNCGEPGSYGCSGTPQPGGMTYPARYSEVISVGATDEDDERASFSSYGSQLDVVAPGSGTIRTPTWTSSNSTTAYSSTSYGTSFASPIVAGVVGAMKGLYPTMTTDEARSFLKTAADNVAAMGGSEEDDEYGEGLVNTETTYADVVTFLGTEGAGIGSNSVNRKPLIVSTVGTRSSRKVTNKRKATSYCVANTNRYCKLVFKKRGSSRVVRFKAKLTDNNGIAHWRYKAQRLGTRKQRTGTWDLYAKLPKKTSNPQTIRVR